MNEKVYFKNSKGQKLVGILSNPTNDKDKPIIILCHGFSTNRDSGKNLNLEKIFGDKGISTFRFDFYGHGESEGKFEDITISEAVDDVLNAIKFLKEEGYKRIGLVGSSFGGISGLMAASKTNELCVLALFCPVSNYKDRDLEKKSEQELKEWKRKGYRMYVSGDGRKLKLNYTFFLDYDNNNGYKAAERVDVPTLIVHGDADESVPVKQSKKTASILKNCKLEIIKGSDHRFSKPEHFDKVLNLISEFIVEHLK